MNRGEIWWASLRRPYGSEPGYRRPVVIIQSDLFNRSAIATVLCAVVTSNLALERAPGNVRLRRRESNLPRESVVNVSQVVTLDKSALSACVGALPAGKLEEVDRGLTLVLGLA